MARRVTDRGVRFVAGWEGFRSCPYRDAVGVWTIGYGETLGVTAHTPCIRREKARAQLRRRLNQDFAKPLRNLIDRRLNRHELNALTSWAYNVGIGAVADSTLRRRLNAGEDKWRVIREELPRWTQGGGQQLEGLVRRRRAEVNVARGDYSGRP